jgi:hypothetical protein
MLSGSCELASIIWSILNATEDTGVDAAIDAVRGKSVANDARDEHKPGSFSAREN